MPFIKKSAIALCMCALAAFSAGPLFSAPPKELVSPESIQMQMISDQDVRIGNVTGESIVSIIRNMVSFDVDGANVLYNRNSGQLFVRHTPAMLDEVGFILNELRSATRKQIDIEARIITVSSTDFAGLGGNFLGFDITRKEGDISFGTTGRIKTASGEALSVTNADFSPNTGFIFPGLEDADGVTGGQFSFYATSNRINFEASIDALETVGEVNTLSAPAITVFNNQRANIKIEDAQNYLAQVNYELIGERGVTLFVAIVSAETVVRLARSGTILDVTPTINADGTITLDLHPTFVRVDLTNTQSFTNRFAGDDFDNTVTLPVYDAQAMDTTLTIPNGGVAVLGGLITETETKALRKLPFFSEIPWIGKYFFTNERAEQVRSYLIMFVRATVRDAQTIQDKVRATV